MFNGNCREAMNTYHRVLGGDLSIQTFGDSPMGAEMDPDSRNLVMHAILKSGNLLIMASDTANGEGSTSGDSVYLSINCNSETEIDNIFAELSKGGKVTMPLQDTFWGAKFAIFIDEFQIPWMLNFDREPAE